MTGDAGSFILQQDRLIKVRVLFPEDVRTSLDKVQALQVRSSSGQLFRIDQVPTSNMTKARRKSAGKSAPDGFGDRASRGKRSRHGNYQIKSHCRKKLDLPPGMTIRIRRTLPGATGEFSRADDLLVLAVLLSSSLADRVSIGSRIPIAIVTGAVLAIAGVLLALFITGMTLNVVR
jgi:multidrug efflux pump subunit AcrB